MEYTLKSERAEHGYSIEGTKSDTHTVVRINNLFRNPLRLKHDLGDAGIQNVVFDLGNYQGASYLPAFARMMTVFLPDSVYLNVPKEQDGKQRGYKSADSIDEALGIFGIRDPNLRSTG